ncbi:prolyl oligopeptidase family serine peptidase [Pseudenhygromyxa sp. WMMC2535]|uniref:alpha/beta hydrolase family protein n=1 Tax=Pseudenhygromyxa sp. WMMC2535 TaxID=2712867 RepID=UPI001553C9E4|nr:CocE/NonD family hydrolase [Pseudenhygromyxa sp. WMMC2535]NVB39285.1 prolyl oligopeptidase family serine peptidase [Pseudenhygromyxa sp. WMMC2535]
MREIASGSGKGVSAALLGLCLATSAACGPGRASPKAPADAGSEASAASEERPVEAARAPYLGRRHAHATVLRERGPSPGKWAELTPPREVAAVAYPSGELELQAWYAEPYAAAPGSAPGLVYFHGDFAFERADFEAVRPFVDAGFAVMTPMLRGENGNPGDFELLWGEVDDGRAAVEWLAAQPVVDRERVYAFGHSIGGGVAAMLSLYPELPLRATGSCGGIYVPETFGRWAASARDEKLVRFDPSDPEETELRVLGPNLAWMVRPHVAYVGEGDPWFIDNAGALADQAWTLGVPFERVIVSGDHSGSLAPALVDFLVRSSSL